MSEKQKKIVEMMSKLSCYLTEQEQERLLSFGEGIAFLVNQRMQPASRQVQAGA